MINLISTLFTRFFTRLLFRLQAHAVSPSSLFHSIQMQFQSQEFDHLLSPPPPPPPSPAKDRLTDIQSDFLKLQFELKNSYRGLKKLSCLFSFVAPVVNLALSHWYIFCQKLYNLPSSHISKHLLNKGWNCSHTSIDCLKISNSAHFLLLSS